MFTNPKRFRLVGLLIAGCAAVVFAAGLLIAGAPRPLSADDAEANADIGFRTEQPGPFLRWPLPHGDITAISRLPDSPWTHEFLGITDCPPYPALLDAGRWTNYVPAGTYPGNRGVVKPGTPDDQVKWQNRTATGLFNNAIACYGARGEPRPLSTHAGTDISELDGTAVFAAAAADEVSVHRSDSGQYRVRLRHPNVNGSGVTWYTYYVHLKSTAWGVGTSRITIAAGQQVGTVGQGHLHFQAAVGPNYSDGEARNPWGIDQYPWDGCLWLDRSLCQEAKSAPNESTELTAPSVGHFTDVPRAFWPFPYVEALYRVGAVQGTGGGATRLFKPLDYTERDQAAKMIDLGLRRKPNYQDNQQAFNDVSPSHPFYQYIRDLKELGIVQGYQGGAYFNDPTKTPPDNTRLTRCQAATLVVRARGETPNYTDNRQTYTDVPRSHACYNAIERLFELDAAPYDPPRFYPDDYVTREKMAYIVVRSLPGLREQMAAFVDVNFDHPFYTHIEGIYRRGITQGCNSTLEPPYLEYCPDSSLKREEAAAFVSRALGFTPGYSDGRQTFPDVAPNHPFYQHIEQLYALGVVRGRSDGTFGPSLDITRREFAKMVKGGLLAVGVACPATHTTSFPDVPAGDADYSAIQCLKDLGISSGYSSGQFRPDDTINRAQAAKLMDLAFLHKVVDVVQEPAEAVNDSPSTAPVLVPLPPPAEADSESTGAPEGIGLTTPNEPGDQDTDIYNFDLTQGSTFTITTSQVGPNAEINLNISQATGLQGASATETPVFAASFDALNASSATFTAAATGRYVFRFTNRKAYATEGVSYRVRVAQAGPTAPPPPPVYSHHLYLPAIQTR